MPTKTATFFSQHQVWQFIRLGFLAIMLVSFSACEQQQSVAAETSDTQTTEKAVKAELDTAFTKDANRVTHFLMGTGSVKGVYFPIGGVICRLLNRHTSSHKIRCSLESTGGSIDNLRQLNSGNYDIVFAQSNWQHHAYHGTSTFKEEGANQQLRAVFALEPDPLALIVKDDSDIKSFEDLAEKKVSFGYTRSLQHRIMNDFLAAKGWKNKKFDAVIPMSDAKQVREICAGNLDAILLLASSLDDRLTEMTDDCKLRLVPIQDGEISKIISDKPYYRTGKIVPHKKLENKKMVDSFGLGATFVALASTSPKAIYHVVKEVVENFNDFRSLHPSLQTLKKQDLPYAGISAPLHPGAIRYYKEARLLKK